MYAKEAIPAIAKRRGYNFFGDDEKSRELMAFGIQVISEMSPFECVKKHFMIL